MSERFRVENLYDMQAAENEKVRLRDELEQAEQTRDLLAERLRELERAAFDYRHCRGVLTDDYNKDLDAALRKAQDTLEALTPTQAGQGSMDKADDVLESAVERERAAQAGQKEEG